jgi:diaminopimelate decarboxylase
VTRLSRHHSEHPFFEVRDDEIVIAGQKASALAELAGRRPFYVYDKAAIRARIARLREIVPSSIDLHFAIKANPLPELVRYVAPLVDGLDVASGRELTVALTTETPRADISFAGPGKSAAELEQAARAGITVNVESTREIRVLAELASQLGIKPRIAVRVNPDFELKTSGMKMSGGPKQFGIDAEVVPQVLRDMRGLPVQFVGFHIFSGSQNLRQEAIVEAQRNALELAVRLAADAPAPITMLNIGGGFGIPYFPTEAPLDLEPIATNLRSIATDAAQRLPTAKLMLELGRFIVGEAGVYVCRVVDRKISRGHVFLVTDGGLHHHLAASGNFGQVIRKNYPVVIANRVNGEPREIASVVGPLCTPLDLLADRMDLARADVGDLVAVLQSGAYGRTASPIDFLSHEPPVELFL